MSVHSLMTGSTYGIHVPYQWTFADATARAVATDPNTGVAYTSSFLGRLCKQTNNNKLYQLTAITPTWVSVSGIKFYQQSAQPSTQDEGDIWDNTNGTVKMYISNSSSGWTTMFTYSPV